MEGLKISKTITRHWPCPFACLGQSGH